MRIIKMTGIKKDKGEARFRVSKTGSCLFVFMTELTPLRKLSAASDFEGAGIPRVPASEGVECAHVFEAILVHA
jgi:hypothetical protein